MEGVQGMTAQTAHRFVPPPAPKTPKAARTRQRLLELAGQLFIERGLDP
jgi:AcrR family transcriptional regulator